MYLYTLQNRELSSTLSERIPSVDFSTIKNFIITLNELTEKIKKYSNFLLKKKLISSSFNGIYSKMVEKRWIYQSS